jgi:hypothetical protein
VTIRARQRKPFRGIAAKFDVESDESVRGLSLPVAGQAFYISLEGKRWRYWILRADDRGPGQSFADAVGRLLPMHSRDLFKRINALATGPVKPTFWERPDGESFIYDLEDPQIVERFALTCAIGEALSKTQRLLSISGKHGARSEGAAVFQDTLPNLSVNVSLWGIVAPSQSVVFFPDGVFLRRTRYQWFVPYEEVDLRYEVSRHTATASTPGDVGVCETGQAVTFGELHLALSDQRVLLQVSSPELAERATKALARLVELAPRPRVKAKASPSGRQRRPKPRASCGQITIKSKAEKARDAARARQAEPSIAVKEAAPVISVSLKKKESAPEPVRDEAPSGGIVIKVKLDPTEPPPTEPDDHGLGTPTPVDDDLGLVFSDVSPMADSPDPYSSAPAAPPAEPQPVAVSDEVRSALGALLAYVAKGDGSFSTSEQRLVRATLQLPRAFDLERAFEAIQPGSSWLSNALERLSVLPQPKRQEALDACAAVAASGGTSPREEERLAEIASALKL